MRYTNAKKEDVPFDALPIIYECRLNGRSFVAFCYERSQLMNRHLMPDVEAIRTVLVYMDVTPQEWVEINNPPNWDARGTLFIGGVIRGQEGEILQ